MSGATGDKGKGFDIVNISGESDEEVLIELQESKQHRINQGSPQEGLASRAGSFPEAVLDEKQGKQRAGAVNARGGVDEARFTAGIARFYEAVLKEPIPEKMLRLVEEIAKRERGS